MSVLANSHGGVVRRRSAAARREPYGGEMDPGDPRALQRAARLLDCVESRIRYFEIESIETLIGKAASLGSRNQHCLAHALTLRIRNHRIHDRFEAAIPSAQGAIVL